MKQLPQRYKYFFLTISAFSLLVFFNTGILQGSDVFELTRGRLWETFYPTNIGGLGGMASPQELITVWPGYRREWPTALAGSYPPRYTTRSGYSLAAKRQDTGEVMEALVWWGNGEAASDQPDSWYLLTENQLLFPNGENHFLKSDPTTAEEVLKTVWEFNWDYKAEYDILYPGLKTQYLPIRFERTVLSWQSYKKDQDYFIINYRITNTSDMEPDSARTLSEMYILFTTPVECCLRGGTLAGLPFRSPDDLVFWDEDRTLVYTYDGDFPEVQNRNPYDFVDTGGMDGTGEWASPGHLGFQILGATPSTTGHPKAINGFQWCGSARAISEQPFYYVSGRDQNWEVMADPSKLAHPMTGDDILRLTSFSNVSLGPWTIAPGQSIDFSTAHMVTGVDFELSCDPTTPESVIASGLDSLLNLADYIQNVNYKNNFNIPDAPAAPETFDIEESKVSGVTGNTLIWSAEGEQIPDPDYTGNDRFDLAGYNVWRSEYTYCGPFTLVGQIDKGETPYYNAATETYSWTDASANVGFSYIYAITAFDTGHNTWPVDPDAYPNGVPSLETSRFNTMIDIFTTKRAPSDELDQILVVPNPFVQESGFTIPREVDKIQFINVPTQCTIQIFTLNGDLVATLENETGFGSVEWNQITDSGQYAESGTYIYYVESFAPDSKGQTKIGKFLIIR